MIYWNKIHKLAPGEFSEDPDKFIEPKLIYSLSDIRKITQRKMYPSPVNGALARDYGDKDSQHYVGNYKNPIRKSTALDIFCEGIPFFTYSYLLASKLFTGIGIYLDTKGPDGEPWIMFHVDIRKYGFNSNSPLIWIVESIDGVDKYRYPQSEPEYWELFNNEGFFSDKQFQIKRS